MKKLAIPGLIEQTYFQYGASICYQGLQVDL